MPINIESHIARHRYQVTKEKAEQNESIYFPKKSTWINERANDEAYPEHDDRGYNLLTFYEPDTPTKSILKQPLKRFK